MKNKRKFFFLIKLRVSFVKSEEIFYLVKMKGTSFINNIACSNGWAVGWLVIKRIL